MVDDRTGARRFRAGQKAYKAGRSAEAPTEALPHFAESFRLAQPLGDAWGMAMAAAGLARVHGAMGDHDAAWYYHDVAADLYRRMQMKDALIAVHLTQADFHAETGDDDMRARRLGFAWRVVRNLHDHPRRAEVANAYVAALRAQGEAQRAVIIENEAARLLR